MAVIILPDAQKDLISLQEYMLNKWSEADGLKAEDEIFDKLVLDPMENAVLLERLTEVAVIVSLFIAGMKLDLPLTDRRWRIPVALATVSMLVTVSLVTAVGVFLLNLPLGLSVLLGAVLAPTDPVLASEVQIADAGDRDRLRFGLTGEGGLNDGTAFPFVMLGLGLIGLHDLGDYSWRWWAVDVFWATAAGLITGWLLGWLVGQAVLYLRRTHKEAWVSDEFISLGLIALAYGTALMCAAYGFLAVFAAGLALGHLDRRDSDRESLLTGAHTTDIQAQKPARPDSIMGAVKKFNAQLERVAEVSLVLATGVMLAAVEFTSAAWWFVPLLFLVIRPVSVWLGLRFITKEAMNQRQKALMAWFGIRGIGSIYYLMYAISHGLTDSQAASLISLTVSVIVTSVVLHGISVTPLMNRYESRKTRRLKRPFERRK